MATQKTETRIDRAGFVPGAAHLALDVVDRGGSTVIAVLQDARTELRAAVEGGIDFAEKTAGAAFRLARKVTQRVDEGVAETLANVERLIGGAVRSARETTKSATDLAQTAVGGIAGSSTAAA